MSIRLFCLVALFALACGDKNRGPVAEPAAVDVAWPDAAPLPDASGQVQGDSSVSSGGVDSESASRSSERGSGVEDAPEDGGSDGAD